jgi:methyltransferase-like protein
MIDQAAIQAVYDQIPYPSLSFNWSHPDHLATIALLVGLQPPPVEACRVLELGCAGGGNLIPMAYSLPGGQFVGVELSARQVGQGQAMIEALGLENIRLERLDLLELGADFGQFDYIIAHGVYSWVPPVVQDKILTICRDNLAPNGVAYISYNTYPGWHMLGSVRDMALYHTRQIEDPLTLVAGSRQLIDFLARSIQTSDSGHADFLKAYVNFVKSYIDQKQDAYLLHDELATFNEPLYFYQFAERIQAHGLRYLADADFKTMLATNLPAEVANELRHMARDTIALEQYMDFLRNRTFRQSLLCHQTVELKRGLSPERLASFYVASRARPESSEPDLYSAAVEKFKTADGVSLATDHPVTKVALMYLAEVWPQAVPFNRLLAAARSRLNGAPTTDLATDARVLAANLLKGFGYSEELVELHSYAPQMVLEVSERPVASPVARFQVQQRYERVTNLRHERIDLDEISQQLLPHLDGSRDQASLLEMLDDLAGRGVMELREDDQPIDEPERRREILAGLLKTRLLQLARSALLVA